MKSPKESQHDVTETAIRKTADLGAKIALSFIPGASTAYELAKLGVTQAQAYVEQKQNQRIVDFHAMLIKQDEHWNQDMADACIEAADYHLLLSACVQDLEDEKQNYTQPLQRMRLCAVSHRKTFVFLPCRYVNYR